MRWRVTATLSETIPACFVEVVYGETELEARDAFYAEYPNNEIIEVKPYIGLREMAAEGDEHEFLTILIEEIEDSTYEEAICGRLYNRGYGRPEG